MLSRAVDAFDWTKLRCFELLATADETLLPPAIEVPVVSTGTWQSRTTVLGRHARLKYLAALNHRHLDQPAKRSWPPVGLYS